MGGRLARVFVCYDFPMAKETTLTEVHELLMYAVDRMATKEGVENGLAAVREEMTDGFTAVREEMAEGFAAICEEMATKVEMSSGFGSVRTELSEIKQQLRELEGKVSDHSNFTKEIDYAFARIAAIERHLGMEARAVA